MKFITLIISLSTFLPTYSQEDTTSVERKFNTMPSKSLFRKLVRDSTNGKQYIRWTYTKKVKTWYYDENENLIEKRVKNPALATRYIIKRKRIEYYPNGNKKEIVKSKEEIGCYMHKLLRKKIRKFDDAEVK